MTGLLKYSTVTRRGFTDCPKVLKSLIPLELDDCWTTVGITENYSYILSIGNQIMEDLFFQILFLVVEQSEVL